MSRLINIPTGIRGQVLCLQLLGAHVWAGLYASPYTQSPLELSVAPRRAPARRRGRQLVIGGQAYPMHSTQLRRAVVWLDHHGVRTTEDATHA
ncbi:hypothetical protein [Xanthomonas sp. XNM01]|uniref:hypothetical protein n=1 Tax=Xanthomonas sp. XNM01 TaxID=2769289 RepID=UPI0017816C39|nr:hypothetical protein [Xanthomonas sp. XNM01]MBD9368828.1 hypothetical protein [Xanthomonas sp. XNM01]